MEATLVIPLLNYFFDLCLLRAKPQDLPASGALLAATLLLNLFIGTLVLTNAFGGAAAAFPAVLVDNLLLLAALGLLLRWRGLTARFRQSATAFFGSGTLMALVAFLLHLAMGPEGEQAAANGLALLLYLALIVWIHVIMGHILRHTLEVSFAQGILMAVVFNLLSTMVGQSLFRVS